MVAETSNRDFVPHRSFFGTAISFEKQGRLRHYAKEADTRSAVGAERNLKVGHRTKARSAPCATGR